MQYCLHCKRKGHWSPVWETYISWLPSVLNRNSFLILCNVQQEGEIQRAVGKSRHKYKFGQQVPMCRWCTGSKEGVQINVLHCCNFKILADLKREGWNRNIKCQDVHFQLKFKKIKENSDWQWHNRRSYYRRGEHRLKLKNCKKAIQFQLISFYDDPI